MRKRYLAILMLSAFSIFFSLQHEGDFSFREAWYHLADEYPIKYETDRLPPPIVSDLNGDGKKEILVATHDAKIQVLEPHLRRVDEGFSEARLLTELSLLPDKTRVVTGRRAVAMATGVIDRRYKEGHPLKQVLVVVTSGWSVMCFDHNLKKLWETNLQEYFPHNAHHREIAISISNYTLKHEDSGLVIIGGRMEMQPRIYLDPFEEIGLAEKNAEEHRRSASEKEMDSNLPNSFTDFLTNESEQFVSQQNDPDQLSYDSNLIGRTTKKAQRSKNFSPEEDCVLVSAWLNTSKDPITGVDQQTRQFWARVHAYFVENGGNLNNRSQISISNRWQEINREVGKFVGFVTQIENRQQSGTTEESRINDARQMYASVVGKRFQLEHCWVILKKEPKWQFERASLHQKSNKKQKNHGNASPASSNPSTDDSVSLGEDNDAFVYQTRPIGQKAAKERLKRRQGKEKVGETSVATILQQLKDRFDEIEVEKKTRQKNYVRATRFID